MLRILTFITAIFLFSCSSSKKIAERGWTEERNNEFLKSCTANIQNEEVKRSKYCKCMLKNLSNNYSYEEAEALSQEELTELAGECL